jgi:hypothetical protein
LAAKFRECATLALPPRSIESAITIIDGIDDLSDIRALTAALAS